MSKFAVTLNYLGTYGFAEYNIMKKPKVQILLLLPRKLKN